MRRLRSRKPSPAMAVALAALVVALGGTALAGPIAQIARKQSGDKLIKKRSLSGNRLKNHTVTGKQIKISSLPKVPSAGSADVAGKAFEATRDSGPGNITGQTAATATPVATLSGLPAGAYVINAKNVVDALSSPDTLVTCRLTAESDFDESSSWMGTPSGGGTVGDVFRAAFPTELTHTFAGPGTVTLSCYKAGTAGNHAVSNARIIANRVASETHTAVSGASDASGSAGTRSHDHAH